MRHRDSRRPQREADRERDHDQQDEEPAGPPELAIVGDLTDNESDLTERLLGVEPGGECTIYFDSPGGNPYCAMSLVTLMRLRGIKATGVVTGSARRRRCGRSRPAGAAWSLPTACSSSTQ